MSPKITARTTSTPTAETRLLPHDTVRAGPGETATAFQRGDFVLVAGTHFNSRLIRFGQKLRRGADPRYVKWTHAALIVDADGTLIEAVGRGVRRWHLDRYRDDDYVVVRVEASPENRDEIVSFAEWALERHARYSRLSTVSMALRMLTGTRLTFFIDGQFVCSGLVAEALERAGNTFDRSSAHIAPADLAKYFGPAAFLYPASSAGAVSTALTSSARDRIPSLR